MSSELVQATFTFAYEIGHCVVHGQTPAVSIAFKIASDLMSSTFLIPVREVDDLIRWLEVAKVNAKAEANRN